MITFKQMRLQHHVVYEDLTWQLNKAKLTVIRGIDRDARISVSNHVGKSLLPSTLTTMLTDAPPVAIKKKSSRDMIKDKSHITLDLIGNDNKSYCFEQYAQSKSVKYKISIDGVEQDVKDIKQARKIINDTVPLTEDHIYSQLYISSYRPSILLFGSAASRLAYFEKIFDIRIYDLLRKSVMTELQSVNEDFLTYNILQKQKTELSPSQNVDVKDRLVKIKTKHENILVEYSRAHNSAQKLTEYVTLSEQLHSNKSIPKLKRQLKLCKNKINIYQKMVNLLQKQQTIANEAKKYHQQRQSLQTKLANIKYRKVDQDIAKIQHKIQKYDSHIKSYARYETHIERYHKFASRYQNKTNGKSPSQLQNQLSQLALKFKQQQQLKSKSHCPVCNQPLTKRHHHDFNLVKRKIKSVKHKMKQAKIVEYIKKVQDKVPLPLLQQDINIVHRKLDKLQKIQQYLLNQSEINEEYRKIKSKLKSLPKPKFYKNNATLDSKLKQHQSKFNKYTEQRFKIKADLVMLEKLAKLPIGNLDFKSAKKALQHEQTIVANLAETLQNLNDKLQQLTEQNTTYLQTKKQMIKINHQLVNLNKSIKDKPILEALTKAYSTKGIRLLQIQALADAYISHLNENSSAIFSQNIKFFAEIGPGKFNILADRRGNVSDVRMLSGAESRQFLALSALALISLMPNRLRCNLLVLDEIEAGLFSTNRKKFAIDFIPLLQQKVENLVIITPHGQDEFYIPNATEKLLVRERGITTWGKT